MVDAMVILGAAARAKLTADRLVRDLVTYFLETTITTSSPRPTASRPRRKKYRLSRSMKPSLSGLGPRPSSRRSKKNMSLMTDAELETELDNRRRHRAKERDLYSRAIRSEKLAALESDLADLRKEMGRIDPVSSKPTLRQRTPHSVRWHPLPRTHRSLETGSSTLSNSLSPPPPQPNNTSSAPPPPPPPPDAVGTEDDVLIVDSEKRKREKEERQRRRELKKKEREQSKKRMSLADIIRSAGPDPMKRLTPATKKAADLEKEEYDEQKKTREEREKRQEKERIEQEKKNLENMGRRIVEQNLTASGSSSQQSEKSGQPDEQPTSSSTSKKQSQDSAVYGLRAEHKNLSLNLEKTSSLEESRVLKREGISDPTSANPTCKQSETGMQDLNTGPGVDAIGTTRTLTGHNYESSESDPERQTKSAESQNDISPSSVTKGGSGRPRQQHDKAQASNKSVKGLVENETRQGLTKAGGFTDLGVDTENMSPNTSSVAGSLKEEREKNQPEANVVAKCPPIP